MSGFLDKPFILCYSIYRVKEQQVLRLIKKRGTGEDVPGQKPVVLIFE